MFVPNRNLDAELMRQPGMRSALLRAGREVAREAERIARAEGEPWMERADAEGLIVVDETDDGVRVTNTDHGGHLVEWGSKNNPPHAPLRRAVQAVGLPFQEH